MKKYNFMHEAKESPAYERYEHKSGKEKREVTKKNFVFAGLRDVVFHHKK